MTPVDRRPGVRVDARPRRRGGCRPLGTVALRAEELSARTGGAVLVCQVLEFHNWH
ncbi:hypothetical protein ACLQ22_22875 [Micromonospora sp. DT178]|uniref:hypothetical protein n=1 Tax=Micromonospora sp. DT178 TaxID=3393436 RepID=UPI003CFA8CA5